MSKRSRNDLRVSDVAKGAHRQVHQRAAGWTIYWAATQRFLSGLSWAQIGRELGWAEGEAETMGAIYVPDEALEDAG